MSVIVSILCLWMMWIVTWLHQWHPIIVPSLPPGFVPPGSGGGHRRLDAAADGGL